VKNQPISIIFGKRHPEETAHRKILIPVLFRLDALALSVIATATWLAGCPSHSGIVSKRQNLSENFFDHLKAKSF